MTGPAALVCPRCGHPVPAHVVVARHVRERSECSMRDLRRWLQDRYAISGSAARRTIGGLLRRGVLRSLGPRGAGGRLAVNDREGAW